MKPDVEVRIANVQRLVEVVDWIIEHTLSIKPATGEIIHDHIPIRPGIDVYLYSDHRGRLYASQYGSVIKACYGDSTIGWVRFRRHRPGRRGPDRSHFELHGALAASFADEVIDIFANRGQTCVYKL